MYKNKFYSNVNDLSAYRLKKWQIDWRLIFLMKQITKPSISIYTYIYIYIVIVRKLSRVSEDIDAAIPSIGDRVNQRSINRAISPRCIIQSRSAGATRVGFSGD